MQFKSPESAVRFVRGLGCAASLYIVLSTALNIYLLLT